MNAPLSFAVDASGILTRRRFPPRNAMGVGSVAPAWLLREKACESIGFGGLVLG